MPGHGGRWIWNFLVHNGREAAVTTAGRAETKQEAADAIRAAWERAQAWSAETGRPLVFGRQRWAEGRWVEEP